MFGKRIFFVVLIALGFIGCSHTKKVSNSTNPAHSVPMQVNGVHDPTLYAVYWYQRAAEVRALYHQGYNMATDQLSSYLKRDSLKLHPAVVLDLVETVLNNSYYQAYAIRHGIQYPEKWDNWISKGDASVLPGATDFLTFADKQGVAIYYITNRKLDELGITIENLKKLNLPQVDSTHVLTKVSTSDKSARREHVSTSHDIVLLIGDNLGDFDQVFQHKSTEERNAEVEENRTAFGRKFIILPNPMYGEWDGASINYQWSQPYDQRTADKVKSLKEF